MVVFIMIAFFIAPTTLFAQSVMLEQSSQSIAPGQTFAFDISVAGMTNLFGAGFDLTFDPAKFEFTGATDGGFLSRSGTQEISLMTAVDPVGNLIFGLTRIGAAAGGVSGTGTLARLNFRSLGSVGSGSFVFSRNNLCIIVGESCDYSTPGSWSGATVAVVSAQSDTVPPITTASPAGGVYTQPQSIVLSANESATIYYTIDGSSPTVNSPIYGAPIQIASTKTLRYFAKDSAGNNELVQTQEYTIASATADIDSPSVPTDVRATAVSATQINIAWTRSTDNVAVAGYNIYRNNGLIGTVVSNEFTDTGLTQGVTYRYTIAAFDTASNSSARSGEVSATTQYPTTASGYYGSATTTGNTITVPAIATTAIPANQIATTTASSLPAQMPLVGATASVNKNDERVPSSSAMASLGLFVTKRHLVLGSKGEDVKKLQKFLTLKGYLAEAATGFYGKATQRAVQKLQKENAIAKEGQDGYGEVGVKTRVAINGMLSTKGVSVATQGAQSIVALQEQIAMLQKQLLLLLEEVNRRKAARVQ